MDNPFGLALGFAYIHIGLAGLVLTVISCIASLVTWLSRGAVIQALPSAFVMLVVPAMALAIIPGAESLAVPLAMAAAFIALYIHVKALGSEQSTVADKIIAVMLGLGLAAIVVSYGLGSLSATG